MINFRHNTKLII